MIQDLKNGQGFIYITDLNNNILGPFPNTCEGLRDARLQAAIVATLAGEILATGSVVITNALAGNITDVSVDGVNQMTSLPVAITVADEAQTAQDLKDSINTGPPAAGPRYTASAKNGTVILTAPPGSGDTLNGKLVTITFTGGSTITTNDIDGGSDGSGVVDNDCGYKFWLDSDVAAPINSIAGATEITNVLVMKGLQTQMDVQDLTISVGTLTPERRSQLTHLVVDTEAAAGTDFLDFIDPTDWRAGDRILISGADATHIVQARDETVSGGNIQLSNNNQFDSGTPEFNLELVLLIDPVAGPTW